MTTLKAMTNESENVSEEYERKSAILGEKYTLIRHKSGLKIYVCPKKLTGTYALFATHYGSSDNRFMLTGENEPTAVPEGIAHFLEHKMFTEEDGSDAFEVFSALGADANAYTSYDKTVFLFNTVSNFPGCLRELLHFVTHPFFTDETVAKERGIIAEEIRMYDDSPASRSYYAMLDGLYKVHDIKKNICGSVESIEKITPEMLYRCHKVFYNLSNMVLAVCGDVDTREVEKIADECLTPSEPCEIIRGKQNEPREINRAKTVQKMQVAKPLFDIGIKDADIPSTADARMKKDIIVSIIGDLLFSQTGELYDTLYGAGLISPGLSSSYTLSPTFGFYTISGESDDPEKVLEIVKAYIERKKKEGFTEEEFERCKKVFYASFVREFDSADDITGNLVSFAFDDYDLFGYADAIFSAKREEALRTMREFFADDMFTLSVILPIEDKKEKNND